MYLESGFSIRRSLRLAGYSWGMANRGKAALHHSQLLQWAIRLTVAGALGATSTPQLEARAIGILSESLMGRRDCRTLCRMLGAFPGLDFSGIRTEYYGKQRPIRIVFGESKADSTKE